MKKIFMPFILLFTLLLASCGETSTATSLLVLEKGQSNNNKDYWIEVLNPNNPDKEDMFKIMIKEEMVWNLIEENKEYYVMYSENGKKTKVLENIQQ